MKLWLILAASLTVGCSGSNPVMPSAPTPAPASTVPLGAGPSFDPVFWREFVHNGYEQPSALQPLRRLMRPPMLYLTTVDEAGQPLDTVTLDTVQAAMQGVAATWGGGMGLAGVQRGTGSMAGVSGWITVRWPNPSAGAFCGFTQGVGVDGTVIDLNYRRTDVSCRCNGSQISAATARHELGHAFGYYHTDNAGDLMSILSPTRACDQQPSAREIAHAQVAYQNPNGSMN